MDSVCVFKKIQKTSTSHSFVSPTLLSYFHVSTHLFERQTAPPIPLIAGTGPGQSQKPETRSLSLHGRNPIIWTIAAASYVFALAGCWIQEQSQPSKLGTLISNAHILTYIQTTRGNTCPQTTLKPGIEDPPLAADSLWFPSFLSLSELPHILAK